MMKSMTGYGKVSAVRNGKTIEVEVRSLNSKTLDVHTKLPQNLNSKDLEIRSLIATELERGKIDLNVVYTEEINENSLRLNEKLLQTYFHKVTETANNLGVEINKSDLINTLLRYPDVQKPEVTDTTEQDWQEVKILVLDALKQVNDFRIQEGNTLKADFVKRVDLILHHLSNVEPYESQRRESIKDKILQRFAEFKGVEVDSNRLEQELIFYIEKLDFTEEKVRLRNHCKYFVETIDNVESTGKKLSFIAQEMGREINTLGSKANDSEIQKLVVMMKDELEKIKEQVLNIL